MGNKQTKTQKLVAALRRGAFTAPQLVTKTGLSCTDSVYAIISHLGGVRRITPNTGLTKYTLKAA